MKGNMLEDAAFLQSDEIDLRVLAQVIWRSRWLILVCTLIVGLLAAGISIRMPNIYRAQTLLAPAEEAGGGGLAALAGRLGGLASLAGMDIRRNEATKTTIAIEVLQSRAFVTDFVRRRDITVLLMATKKWDADKEQVVIDENVYDPEAKRWMINKLDKHSGAPTDWDIYKKFTEILKVERNKDSGLITVAIDFPSPFLAKQWVDWLVKDVNAQVRKMDVDEATKSIEYLKQQLQETPIKEMQQIFYQLIEKQMQTIMLANVRDQYVFKVVDPAVVPQEKVSPRRSLIVVVVMMAVFLLCIVVVVAINAMKDPG